MQRYLIAKISEQHKSPSTDEWIMKIYVHTVNSYSAIKKNDEILPFVSNMDFDLDRIMLSEISLTEKD